MLDFLSKKESSSETFLSLVLEAGSVAAGIWFIGSSGLEMLDVSPLSFWNDDSELTNAIDTALSSCVQKLPENTKDPQKCVFGVPSSWVKDNEIKEEYLVKIKKACQELSILPSGFVSLPEAIAYYFKIREGVPLSAVIVGLGTSEIEVSIFKTGSLIGSTQVARSLSISDDVNEGLSRLSDSSVQEQEGSLLPSRIIIYDGKESDLEEAREALSDENWTGSERIKFLHLPKVETVKVSEKVLAVSLAGATEIVGVSRLKITEEKVPVNSAENQFEEIENLGFVVEKENLSPHIEPHPVFAETALNHKQDTEKKQIPWSSNLFRKLKDFKFPQVNFNLSFIVVVFLAFTVGVGALLLFYPKATVSIYVTPKVLEEDLEVKFDADQVVSVLVSGDKTKNTTGLKMVGEKARGTVQIRNGTASDINLVSGTSLLSVGNLEFKLDNAVSISAALSPNSPGTAIAQVTAAAIGAEYNLAKDELLKVGSYPKAEVDAVATDNFSGGSSREIAAVSAEDRSQLRQELEAELIKEAKQKLAEKAKPDEIFVPEIVSLKEEESLFSHKVGDEAENLKLSLSFNAQGVIANRNDFINLIKEKMKDKIPSGFILKDDQIFYEFEFLPDRSKESFYFKLNAKVNLLPDIKRDEMIKNMSGQRPKVMESYFRSIPGFTVAKIKIKPHFSGWFERFPLLKKNITIELLSE